MFFFSHECCMKLLINPKQIISLLKNSKTKSQVGVVRSFPIPLSGRLTRKVHIRVEEKCSIMSNIYILNIAN